MFLGTLKATCSIMEFAEIIIARGKIYQAKHELMYHDWFDSNDYKMARMHLLDLVFEYKEILSDKEYLSLMNLK